MIAARFLAFILGTVFSFNGLAWIPSNYIEQGIESYNDLKMKVIDMKALTASYIKSFVNAKYLKAREDPLSSFDHISNIYEDEDGNIFLVHNTQSHGFKDHIMIRSDGSDITCTSLDADMNATDSFYLDGIHFKHPIKDYISKMSKGLNAVCSILQYFTEEELRDMKMRRMIRRFLEVYRIFYNDPTKFFVKQTGISEDKKDKKKDEAYDKKYKDMLKRNICNRKKLCN